MKLTGRHVLFAMLAFFGLVAAVNSGMIYFAVSTFSGLETKDAYRKGLAYNEVLSAAERQQQLGWAVELDAQPLGGGWIAVEASFRDRDAVALDGLEVTAALGRPAHQGHDTVVTLASKGGGRYAAETELPLAGQWDLRLEAHDGGELRYRLEQRLWLK